MTLLRRLPYERVTDFLESGALPARSLNDEYDYLTACVQQLADDALTALHYAPTDLPASSVLPGRAARANQLLAFDGGGAVDCMVRNMSNTGARVEVVNPVGLPGAFTQVIPSDKFTRRCHAVWSHDKRIGVAFD